MRSQINRLILLIRHATRSPERDLDYPLSSVAKSVPREKLTLNIT